MITTYNVKQQEWVYYLYSSQPPGEIQMFGFTFGEFIMAIFS